MDAHNLNALGYKLAETAISATVRRRRAMTRRALIICDETLRCSKEALTYNRKWHDHSTACASHAPTFATRWHGLSFGRSVFSKRLTSRACRYRSALAQAKTSCPVANRDKPITG
jgi:hypothetical protein